MQKLTQAIAARTNQRFSYAWVVVGLIFLVLLTSAGIRATPSVMILPLEHEFGWNRSTISLAISFNIALYGLIGPFAAAAMQRFGIRPVVIGALALLSVGTALSTLMTMPWHMLLTWGLLVGSSTGVAANTLGATIVSRWFEQRRGLAMGMLDLVGTTLSGWLSDRFNPRVLLFWYYGLRGLALIFLPYAFGLQYFGLTIFAIFYGLDWIATVPPTVRLANDVFGRLSAPIVFGWIVAGHQLGAATATTVAGYLRSTLGNYTLSSVLMGSACLIGAVLVLRIRGDRHTTPVPVPA